MIRLFTLLALFLAGAARAELDPLAQVVVPVPGPHGASSVERAASDLRDVFRRYQPGLDESTTIVKPVHVSGRKSEPELTVSVQKCVAIVCQTVDLDGIGTMREVAGPCTKNFLLTIDLSRSSPTLSTIYDALVAQACYRDDRRHRDGSGTLTLDSSLQRAAGFQYGFAQQEIFKMLGLQIGPISQAIQETLRHKAKLGEF